MFINVLVHLQKCQLQGQQKYTDTTHIYTNGTLHKTKEQQIWEQQQQQRRNKNVHHYEYHYHHHKQRRQKNKNNKQQKTNMSLVLI